METMPIQEALEKLTNGESPFIDNGSVCLTKNGQVVATLTPAKQTEPTLPKGPTGAEAAKILSARKPMPRDEAEAFARDVEEAIRLGNQHDSQVPWLS